ncbi:hypothetical protein PM10SUCC1_33890 [Propionigenium maris DSM 9537]|uniref:SHOCT domain-containing protein n=1 Tax=Propionigenium maris DSM 9537 TaxID=1123000 RepID=A0A9W6LQ37_9FUSO|nr:SHOCT domain-containing protein [Propionigenium maris]GLI57875.1 hypothetical protein PM10SUCC1_33890 [Propionigenium maris DSM 9537]
MHHMYFSGGIFRWFMGIFHLILPILAVILLFNLFSSRRRYSYFEDYRRDPMDILRERYARGELTREEFMRMRSELRP